MTMVGVGHRSTMMASVNASPSMTTLRGATGTCATTAPSTLITRMYSRRAGSKIKG